VRLRGLARPNASAAWWSSERLSDSPPIQRHYPPRGEREVGVGVVRTLAQEAVSAVEHGGDEEAVADRANLAFGDVFERGGGEVASAAQVGAQVLANPGAGCRKGVLTCQQFTAAQGHGLFVSRVCDGLKARRCQRRMVGENVSQWMDMDIPFR
jgi:hypothetical protein